jgi:alpha-ketoglutarate-dependent taurine dioxygenase
MVRAAYDATRCVVSWEPGDVLLLDNLVTAHETALSATFPIRTALSRLR